MICSACMQLTCPFPSIGTLIFCRHWFTWQTRMCIVLLYFSLCMAILLDNPFMLYYTFQCYYNTSLVMACGITSFRIWVTIKIFTTAVMAQVQLTAQTHLLYLLFDELPCISASRYWGDVTDLEFWDVINWLMTATWTLKYWYLFFFFPWSCSN
jgi:hypothetical protein